MTPVFCVWWWLKLRRTGLANFEVAPLVVWLLVQIAWMLWARAGSAEFGADPWEGPFAGTYFGSAVKTSLLAEDWLAVLCFWLAVAAVVLMVLLSLVPRLRIPPLAAVYLALPLLALYWVTIPLALAHMAWVVGLIAFVIWREMRRLEIAGSGRRVGSGFSVLSVLGVMLVSVGAVLGVWSAIDWALNRGLNDTPLGLDFVIWQATMVGIIAPILLWVCVAKGWSSRYGAPLIALSFMSVMVGIFGPAMPTSWSSNFGMREYLLSIAAAGAVLTVMWRVFGPGALPRVDRGEVAESELTKG